MTQVVGTVYNGSTAATSHTVTVPSGVTTGMTGLFIIGTGSSDAATTTLSQAGSTFSKLDEQNAVNTRVAVWTGTNLAAGNTVTLTLSSSQAVTVAHYYQDDYTFGTLAAAIRSTSTAVSTTGSVTPTSGQKVIVVGVERTTTATTVSSVTSSGGESVTQISYGEGTGSAQASCYIGEFTASAGAARTATITYSNASGNGYAAALLTTASGGGGGGQGPGGSYTTPGQAHNIGKGSGKNHFNLGVGYPSGHVDKTENQVEGGFSESPYYYLNADKTAVIMSVPLDGGRTSSNTKYPRVEYRELDPGGSGDSDTTKAAWDGSTGDHYITGWTKIVKIPPNKPEVVIAQIHDASDDVAKFKWRGTGSSASMIATYGDNDYATIATGLSVGTWYQWKLRAINGAIEFYWVNMSTPKVKISDATAVQASGQYFKAGNYAQTANNSVTQTDSVSSGPLIIELRDLECWHTGYPPPATPAGVPTVNAGEDTTITVGATWARTASEVANGSTITSRTWKVQSGPAGVGSTIDTDANLAWTPTTVGAYVLRYSATNSTGTGFDDVNITVVNVDDPTDPPVGTVYQEKFPDGVPWPVVTKQATTVNVSTGSGLASALSAATAGQKIVLASGSYTGTYTLSGKSDVSIVAATLGGATLGSGSQLTIKDCTNVWVEGLNWTTDSAIEAANIRGISKNVRFDQCTFGPSTAAVSSANSGQYAYVSDSANLIRFDYCLFRNKGTAGNCVKVYGNDAVGQVNQHILIAHCGFTGVKPEISNGKEPTRLGVSTMSKSMSYSTFCRNWVSDNLAEPELFSGKAGGLLVYGNTFYRNAGGGVLRHGTDCVMSDNYFIDGNNTTASAGLKSGGVRFYDSGHEISHNYFDGLAGVGFQASLLIDRGDAEGSSTNLAGHWRVIDALVDANVIVNSATPIVVWNGSQYSLDPSGVTITNIITAGTTQAGPRRFNGGAALVSSPTPAGNVHYASPAAAGMTQDADGIWRKTGYGPRLTYIKQSDVGPGGTTYDTDRAGTPLGGPTAPSAPVVNAGGGATILPGQVFSRTATETGSGITARRWSIEAGPVAPSARPLVGWGGNDGVDVPGLTNEIQGAFMGRTSWANLSNGDWLTDGPLPAYKAAHPNAACLIGVPLIPHDSVSPSGWNTLLDEAASGSRDSVYTALGGKLAAVTPQTCYARVWWEFNVDSDDQINATKFKAAWARAVPLIRQGFAAAAPGKTLKIVFNSMPDRSTKEALYPGGSFVDVVSYDTYGQRYGSTNPTKAEVTTLTAGYLNDLRTWGQSVGKPVAIDEWACWHVVSGSGTTNRGTGDHPEFITQIFDFATDPSSNCAYVCYFNEGGGGVELTLNDIPNARQVFVSRAQALQSGSGSTSGQGATLSTTQSVSWTPTVVGTYVLRYSATNAAGTGTNDATITVSTSTGGGSTTAPDLVAIVRNSGESTAVEAPPPAGVQAGDAQATVILSAGAETIVDPIPAGWTLWDTATVTSPAGDPGGPCTAWLYTSTTTTSPAVWTKSGARKWHVVRAAWRGQTAFGQHAVTAETSGSTGHPTPAVSPVRANSRVVGVVCSDRVNSAAGPFTPPSGWTERYDETVTVGTESLSITLADVVAGASSTTGTFTSTIADECAVFALVLEGPQAEQVLLLQGIPPTGAPGTLTVGFAGPPQTITLAGIPATSRAGKLAVSVAPAPITIQLQGIPPR